MELDFDNLTIIGFCTIAVVLIVSILVATAYEDKKKSEFLTACIQKSTPEECVRAWK